jgi:cobalt/nickel transport system permease protein
MWRYLFVLADEAIRLMRARLARSGHADLPDLKPGGSIAWRGRVAGGMVGNLFLRAFERSDRIYMAMLARGYDGEMRSAPLPVLSNSNWLVLLLSLGILAVLLAFALLFWA